MTQKGWRISWALGQGRTLVGYGELIHSQLTQGRHVASSSAPLLLLCIQYSFQGQNAFYSPCQYFVGRSLSW